MQKKLMLAFVLLLVASLVFASVAWAQDEDEPVLARLEVRNRTDQPVSLVLTLTDPETEGDVFASALTISAGTTRTFTVPKGLYTHTTFACGESADGTLDLTRQTRLIFTQCNKEVTHQGEPTMEKINLGQDTPSGIFFGYQIN